ncbi:MAG: hypothetical protein COB86_02000 [Dehalococcoidia bacterium]|nr:MAG: hypothetical protein COB86_02000 [Dehalococcoidia bacterium]
MNNRPDFDFCPDIRAELPRQAQAQFSAMQSHIEEFESRVREFDLGEWWLRSRDPRPIHVEPQYAAQFKESSVVEAYKYRTPYSSEIFSILS